MRTIKRLPVELNPDDKKKHLLFIHSPRVGHGLVKILRVPEMNTVPSLPSRCCPVGLCPITGHGDCNIQGPAQSG